MQYCTWDMGMWVRAGEDVPESECTMEYEARRIKCSRVLTGGRAGGMSSGFKGKQPPVAVGEFWWRGRCVRR